MEQNKLLKFVYDDNQSTKVLRGYLLSEDEHSYKIKPQYGNDEMIILGKRFIIKVYAVGGSQ